MEKRDEERKYKALRVSIDAGRGPIYGSTINVSPEGMGITLKNKRAFQIGQAVKLKVSKNRKDYHFSGKIAWFRQEILSNTMGIKLSEINPDFCKDILGIDVVVVGGQDRPYKKVYKDKAAFLDDYNEHLKFGGLFISCENGMPELNSLIWIELTPPTASSSCLIQGRVVIHQPGGFGVMIQDQMELDNKLKAAFAR